MYANFLYLDKKKRTGFFAGVLCKNLEILCFWNQRGKSHFQFDKKDFLSDFQEAMNRILLLSDLSKHFN